MKYLFLLNNSAEQWDEWRSLSRAERHERREESLPRWNDLFGWMSEQGIDVSGLELEDPANARVVRVQDGETLVTDGPFAETKEVLGGFYLIDVPNLDDALEFAAAVPAARRGGSVEVRPLVER